MLNNMFPLFYPVHALCNCQVACMHVQCMKDLKYSYLWTIQDEINWNLEVILYLPRRLFN